MATLAMDQRHQETVVIQYICNTCGWHTVSHSPDRLTQHFLGHFEAADGSAQDRRRKLARAMKCKGLRSKVCTELLTAAQARALAMQKCHVAAQYVKLTTGEDFTGPAVQGSGHAVSWSGALSSRTCPGGNHGGRALPRHHSGAGIRGRIGAQPRSRMDQGGQREAEALALRAVGHHARSSELPEQPCGALCLHEFSAGR